MRQKSKLKSKLNILANLTKITSLTAFFAVGLFASQNIDENYLKQPVENLSYSDYDEFILGKSFFTIPWVPSPSSTTARDGLGPLFNANTCVSCHPKNGRGILFTKDNLTSRSLVARLSLEDINKDKKIISKKGFIPEPRYGSQISINGTVNTKYEAKIKLDFTEVEVKFPDGEIVKLLKPNYSLENLNYGKLHKNTNITYRIANSLNGMGLIEQIPNEQILANEDIDDKNSDGISGKANRVYSKITKKEEIGRFTHKASVAFLDEQVANAANEDMGLTSNLNPNDNCTKTQKECLKESKLSNDIDIPDFRIESISFYIKNLKTYSAKKDDNYLKGLELFENLGCAKCHVSSFTLNNGKQIAPFSDFLLHDMGEELSDGRVEFDAQKSEFRTAPLWGLVLHEKINGKKPRLLHDGRARTFQEAILWHGGEASRAKTNYMNLEKKQREKLIEFLEKL